MTTVQSINSAPVPANAPKNVTKKGNPYEKTNIGKYSGTAVGAIGGGYMTYQLLDTFKKVKETVKPNEVLTYIANAFSSVIPDLKSQLGIITETETAEISKYMKRGVYGAGAAILGITALVGLGIGALVDYGINKYRANSADKVAETPVEKVEEAADTEKV